MCLRGIVIWNSLQRVSVTEEVTETLFFSTCPQQISKIFSVMNITLTFHSNYNSWSAEISNDTMLEELTNYSATCYNDDGEYAEDIDLAKVREIVDNHTINVVAEVVEDTLSS